MGLLANLTPISGVYTSIFSSLLYVIFGTVPYISMGPNALLALMTGCTVEREAESIFSQGGRLPGGLLFILSTILLLFVVKDDDDDDDDHDDHDDHDDGNL